MQWLVRYYVTFLIVTGNAATLLRAVDCARGGVIADYDMRDYGEFWSLPLTFRGSTYRFLVDTGSGQFAFDEQWRELLGEPVRRGRIETNTRDVELPIFLVREARVGGVPMRRPCTAACIDLSGLKACAGPDVAGVLGCAFLRSYIVQFDFEQAHLRFLTSVPQNAGFKIPFDGDDMRPRCRCSLDGEDEASFLLDSGSVPTFSVTLRKQLFDDLAGEAITSNSVVVVPRLNVIGTEATGEVFDDDQVEPCGILRQFKLGEIALERVRALRARFSTLGLRFMSRFVVTIDFPNRAIYFRPIEGAERDDFDAGVIISRNRTRTFVRAVVPIGAAAGTGLTPGDDILRVDGTETETIHIFALRRILGRQGHVTTLDIKRADGTELTVRIPPSGD